MRKCWCDSTSFSFFNQDYAVCDVCKTLVLQSRLTDETLLVKNDETDFYGKQYWLNHQTQDLGNADIYTRSRSDLSERNLHWLKTLLKYKLPPAKVLELGCSHGSFVALLRQTGYDASGVELSPWVVNYGSNIFDIPVSIGPLEDLNFTENFDAIVLMDVLEHLPNPIATITHCVSLLKPDGILLIQTPQFREEIKYQDLIDNNGAFLPLLKPDEHIYLFTESSISKFFQQLNMPFIQFEPAIFAHYDMFFAVSRTSFEHNSTEKIEPLLLNNPKSRFVVSLLDLHERELQLTRQLEVSEGDRAARWEQIQVLTTMVKQLESDNIEQRNQLQVYNEKNNHFENNLSFYKNNLNTLLSRRPFRLFTRFVKWPELMDLKKTLNDQPPKPNPSLKTVAIDLTPILPGGENGGAKIFVLELIKQLADLVPNTQFILLTQAASHDELTLMESHNIKCKMVLNAPVKDSFLYHLLVAVARKLPYKPRKLSYLGYRLSVFLKRRKTPFLLQGLNVDLLFCPFTAPTYYELGIPTVCTLYDLQYKTYPEFFAPEDVAHREHTFKEACRRASMLTAISEYSRQSAIVHGNLKPEKIRTIYLQMAHRILPEEDQDKSILTLLDLTPQQYLLYPANFWKHKNHEMLLTAFGIASKNGLASDVKLVCTGAGSARLSSLTDAAHMMGLGERIVFPGYLTDAELAMLMANASGVIFPSLYEGFGLPVVEAMAAGIPVACSNLTSLPEVVGEAAILFNPRIPTQIAEAIISLQNDKKLCKRLIDAGKERAKLFEDSSRMAQEYWYLFQYALRENEQQDQLTGAYEDGWVGSQMNVQVAPSTNKQMLEMELFVPDWTPQSKIVVRALRDGKMQAAPLEVRRGEKALLTLPLSADGGCLEIKMKPTFIPAKTGYSNSDRRELSLVVRRCRVIRDGGSVQLITGKKSA